MSMHTPYEGASSSHLCFVQTAQFHDGVVDQCEVLWPREAVVAVLDIVNLHIGGRELCLDLFALLPWHIRVLLAMDQARRAGDRDLRAEDQVPASIVEQFFGERIG